MMLRLWTIVTILFVAAAWYVTVIAAPPPYQASPGSFARAYLESGALPDPASVGEAEEIEHEAFVVPPEDAAHVPEEPEPGLQILAAGRTGEVAGQLGNIESVRTIELTLSEWRLDPGTFSLMPGEIVRLTVTNRGALPHEFMIMSQAAMKGVSYRLARADWNLFEHKALVERSFLLPGDSFEIVLRAEKPGMWMAMCMLPYHMQFGMMAMLQAGMAMEGAGGGMKM